MIKEVNLLLILAGMLLGPLLLNWRAVKANLRGLKVERNLPLRICAGDVLSVDLNLTNTRQEAGLLGGRGRRADPAGDGQWPRNNHRRQPTLRPSVLFPYAPAGQSRKGVYRGRLVERGRYRLRAAAGFDAVPLRPVLAHDHPGQARNADRAAAAGPADAGLGGAAAGGVRRNGSPPAAAGQRGRFLRRPRVAQRRRPAADPLAKLGAVGQAGRAAIRAAAQPRRGRRARSLAARAASSPNTSKTSNWPSASPPRCWPTCAARAAATFIWRSATAGRSASADRRRSATLQWLMEQLALAEARADAALPALLAATLRQVTAGTEVVLVSTRRGRSDRCGAVRGR